MATKAQFIETLHDEVNFPDEEEISKARVERIYDEVFALLKDEISTAGRVSVPGFGIFTKKRRNARQGKNPQTGESLTIAAHNVVTFKPAADLKDQIN